MPPGTTLRGSRRGSSIAGAPLEWAVTYWLNHPFVDWVGVDIYSKYRSAAFPKMRSFFRRWDRWPFVIGEYSPWDDDVGGGFTRHLLRWERRHNRVKLLINYRGGPPATPTTSATTRARGRHCATPSSTTASSRTLPARAEAY